MVLFESFSWSTVHLFWGWGGGSSSTCSTMGIWAALDSLSISYSAASSGSGISIIISGSGSGFGSSSTTTSSSTASSSYLGNNFSYISTCLCANFARFLFEALELIETVPLCVSTSFASDSSLLCL